MRIDCDDGERRTEVGIAVLIAVTTGRYGLAEVVFELWRCGSSGEGRLIHRVDLIRKLHVAILDSPRIRQHGARLERDSGRLLVRKRRGWARSHGGAR